MGIMRAWTRWRRKSESVSGGAEANQHCRNRSCVVEPVEPRVLLAADIHVGAVYFEEASGDDAAADTLEITFEGGAAGTTLTELSIDGDKLLDGSVTLGDVFFDTEPGGLGTFNSVGLVIAEHNGFEVTDVQIADGSSLVVFRFSGFEAGEKLVFSVDVDEQGSFSATALAEGGEFEGSRLHARFEAPHYHPSEGEAIFFDAFDGNFATAAAQTGTTLDLPPDDYMPPDVQDRTDRTAGAVMSLEQVPLPSTLSGRVYVDEDFDLTQDLPADAGLASVELELWREAANGFEDTGLRATSNAQGDYAFRDLLPGVYRVVQRQPVLYVSVGATAGQVAGETRGQVVGTDEITEIELRGGEDSRFNNFAEILPARLSGHVYHDRDNDGSRDPGEEGITGVRLRVIPVNIVGPSTEPLETETDENGFWSVEGLMPGEYRVVEAEQPAGFLDGLDRAGTAGGQADNPGDEITGIALAGGQHGENYDFGEIRPGRISGRVHADRDGDCLPDADEQRLEGVVIELLNAAGQVLQTTRTNSQGEYAFDGLAPGTYAVREIQPEGYLDGGEHIGTAGGTIGGDDLITNIVIGSGTQAEEYNFCEFAPASLHGRVFVDGDGNGLFGGSESGISGVTIELLDASGDVLATTSTNATGEYWFMGLLPGTYAVREVQPAGYLDSGERAGTSGGVASNDFISEIFLHGGAEALNYDFWEVLPSRISGRVFVSQDGDCVFHEDDDTVEGVTIQLLDAAGDVIRTTVTDANGIYAFEGLRPGTYGIRELQPAGLLDGSEHVGTAGGTVAGDDLIDDIVLASGTNAEEYDFCEFEPSQLSGNVFEDRNDDNTRQADEPGIAGVTIELLNTTGNVVRTTRTDANGHYRFDNLLPGTYAVREIQPVGFLDSAERPGSAGGVVAENDLLAQITLRSGTVARDYDFWEIRPSSISGRVHVDEDGRCTYEPGDETIAGVTILLLDASGTEIARTATDAGGEYRFAGLRPGTYAVVEIQPEEFLEGSARAGSEGGVVLPPNRIEQIELESRTDAVNYEFCETEPLSISGYVFQDGPAITLISGEEVDIPVQRDGRRTSDDAPIAGVTLTLADFNARPLRDVSGNLIQTVTDSSGFYMFSRLGPGSYTVLQSHPDEFIDSKDTPGSTGGIAINEDDEEISPEFISGLATDPQFDAIVRIQLPRGVDSVENNFSEVLVVEPRVWFLPEDPVPTENSPPAIIPVVARLPVTFAPVLVSPEPPPLFGGSSPVMGYTWHLSVVDAGRPRGTLVPVGFRSATPQINSIAWNRRNLHEASWEIQTEEASADRRQAMLEPAPQRAIFGTQGSIPVTGDFNGDGVSEVGVFISGEWYIDVNGNGIWDEGDLWAKLGHRDDLPVTGDWDGDGKTDIGIFGPAWPGDPVAIEVEPGLPNPLNPTKPAWKNVPPERHLAPDGERLLRLTATGPLRGDVIDHVFAFGVAGDWPLAGDFSGDGIDTIAIYRQGRWHLDMDGDGRWSDGDKYIEYGQPDDVPIVGDFDGNGVDEIGVYRKGDWYADLDKNGKLDPSDLFARMGESDDIPVVGDWNADGVDQPGLFHPNGGTELPR